MPIKSPKQKPIQGGLTYEVAGPKFAEFHKFCDKTTRLLIGAYGSGKTFAGLYEVLWLLLASKTYQGKTAIIVARDHAMARNKLLKDIKRIMAGDAAKKIPRIPKQAYRINLTPPILIEFWNGSRIMFYTHSTEDSIEGLDASVILLDEANKAPESLYYTLINRLGREGIPGKFIICANPTNKSGWLYEKFWKVYEETGSFPEDCHGVAVSLYDNRFIPQFRIQQMERDYAHSEIMRQRAVLGLFASNDGLVYSQFDRDKHVLSAEQRPAFDDKWQFFSGLDFGFRDHTAYLIVAYNPANLSYYVIKEYKRSQQMLKSNASAITEMNISLPKLPTIYSEHDAQTRNEYAALGVHTVIANKELLPGINHIQTLFSENRLFVFDNCKSLVKELESYAWSEKKDAPALHQQDHLLDALRYALFSVNHAGGVKIYLPGDFEKSFASEQFQSRKKVFLGTYDRKGNPEYVYIK